jgi:hypothetical protein
MIYFDRHEDSNDPMINRTDLMNYRKNLPSEREFWSIVEWDISTMDDDWLKTGMDLGLIGDAILIDGNQNDNFNRYENIYNDCIGQKHKIFKVDHIWSGLEYQGWLNDSAQSRIFQPIWDVIGWQPLRKKFVKKAPFIVDFDLDYFMGNFLDGMIPWPENIMYDLLNKHTYHQITSLEFLKILFEQADFITIARETDHCGSISNNNLIYQNVSNIVFNGELK